MLTWTAWLRAMMVMLIITLIKIILIIMIIIIIDQCGGLDLDGVVESNVAVIGATRVDSRAGVICKKRKGSQLCMNIYIC